MPGAKHVVVIFDNEHPLKPQTKVCYNRYGKSVVNKPSEIGHGMAKFAEGNYDQPGEAAGNKPSIKQCFHLAGKNA